MPSCVRVFQEVHACASVMQDQVIDHQWRFACMLTYASKAWASWARDTGVEEHRSISGPNLLKPIAGTLHPHFKYTSHVRNA